MNKNDLMNMVSEFLPLKEKAKLDSEFYIKKYREELRLRKPNNLKGLIANGFYETALRWKEDNIKDKVLSISANLKDPIAFRYFLDRFKNRRKYYTQMEHIDLIDENYMSKAEILKLSTVGVYEATFLNIKDIFRLVEENFIKRFASFLLPNEIVTLPNNQAKIVFIDGLEKGWLTDDKIQEIINEDFGGNHWRFKDSNTSIMLRLLAEEKYDFRNINFIPLDTRFNNFRISYDMIDFLSSILDDESWIKFLHGIHTDSEAFFYAIKKRTPSNPRRLLSMMITKNYSKESLNRLHDMIREGQI